MNYQLQQWLYEGNDEEAFDHLKDNEEKNELLNELSKLDCFGTKNEARLLRQNLVCKVFINTYLTQKNAL